MGDPLVERLHETYDAFAHGRLDRIPDLFTADGYYRTSGVFPGMKERYTGHEEIAEFWHQSTEPWEHLGIETGATLVRGDRVASQVWLVGRGFGSGVDVRIEAGHLVRFRELKIAEFLAFANYAMALDELERT